MARTKAFDQTVALDQAMTLFWERGYEATSVRDLITTTGISTSSLYNAFGDKREIYIAALERYRQAERRRFEEMLASPEPVRRMLAGLFDDLIDILSADDGAKGSFTLNAAIELGGRDAGVTAELRDHFDDLSGLLAERLAEAQRQGEIAPRFAPLDWARYVLFSLYSLATMAKVYDGRAGLDKMAEIVLATFD